jgi:hypothetical protein
MKALVRAHLSTRGVYHLACSIIMRPFVYTYGVGMPRFTAIARIHVKPTQRTARDARGPIRIQLRCRSAPYTQRWAIAYPSSSKLTEVRAAAIQSVADPSNHLHAEQDSRVCLSMQSDTVTILVCGLRPMYDDGQVIKSMSATTSSELTGDAGVIVKRP